MANLIDPFYPVVLDELVRQIQARGFQTLLSFPLPIRTWTTSCQTCCNIR
jgi:hypothetical protein